MARLGLPIVAVALSYKLLSVITPDVSIAGQSATWVATAIVFALSVLDKVKSSKERNRVQKDTELLSESQMWKSKAEIMKTASEDNLKLYQAEREEHKKTRDYWHEKSSEFQTTLSKCQDKLLELEHRPNLTEVMRSIEHTAELSGKILEGIKEIIIHLTKTSRL